MKEEQSYTYTPRISRTSVLQLHLSSYSKSLFYSPLSHLKENTEKDKYKKRQLYSEPVLQGLVVLYNINTSISRDKKKPLYSFEHGGISLCALPLPPPINQPTNQKSKNKKYIKVSERRSVEQGRYLNHFLLSFGHDHACRHYLHTSG